MEGQVLAQERIAIGRLRALLSYVKELAALSTKDAQPVTELRSAASAGVVLHEESLRRLLDCTCCEDGMPVLTLGSDGDDGAGDGAWMRLRRPAAAARATPLGRLASSAYADLFTARQEGLRDGRGAQLTVGVGIVRWAADGKRVDHPLVLMPAELQLEPDGALVVRMGEAASAKLWLFPGIATAAPALAQLDECARNYRFIGTLAPPPPTDREAWAPLLKRAAHCLAPDGAYLETPPTATRRAALTAAPIVHNSFVLFTRDTEAAGERTVAKDAEALSRCLGSLPAGALPPALARLAGIFSLTPTLALPTRAGCAVRAWRALCGGSGSAAGASLRQNALGGIGEPPPVKLYFGLPSNAEQESVVAVLERHGCAVLVGPPGTGKSQTIANVICHYLALGKRVLVTSKGEPATEVLRAKLPPGIRELCVSLGSGDTASFRRLEAAVEHLGA